MDHSKKKIEYAVKLEIASSVPSIDSAAFKDKAERLLSVCGFIGGQSYKTRPSPRMCGGKERKFHVEFQLISELADSCHKSSDISGGPGGVIEKSDLLKNHFSRDVLQGSSSWTFCPGIKIHATIAQATDQTCDIVGKNNNNRILLQAAFCRNSIFS